MSDSAFCDRCGQYMPMRLSGESRVHGCDRTPPLDGLPPTIYACPVCAGHSLHRYGCIGTQENPHPNAFMKPIHELIREQPMPEQRVADEQLRAIIALSKSDPLRFLMLYGRDPSELSPSVSLEEAEAILTKLFEAAKMDSSTATKEA